MNLTSDCKMDSKLEIAAASNRTDVEEGSIEKSISSPSIHGWGKSRFCAVETTGIQRVTDADREQNTTHVWNACTFWYVGKSSHFDSLTDCIRLSANMAVATLSTGMVGGALGLAFWDSFAIIVVVNLISCLLPAWTESFGLTGLRMTTFS